MDYLEPGEFYSFMGISLSAVAQATRKTGAACIMYGREQCRPENPHILREGPSLIFDYLT